MCTVCVTLQDSKSLFHKKEFEKSPKKKNLKSVCLSFFQIKACSWSFQSWNNPQNINSIVIESINTRKVNKPPSFSLNWNDYIALKRLELIRWKLNYLKLKRFIQKSVEIESIKIEPIKMKSIKNSDSKFNQKKLEEFNR